MPTNPPDRPPLYKPYVPMLMGAAERATAALRFLHRPKIGAQCSAFGISGRQTPHFIDRRILGQPEPANATLRA